MPSKENYSSVFNRLLGTDINWAKLSKEELASLAIIFNNPNVLMQKLGVSPEAKQQLIREKAVDVAVGVLETWQGPLAQLARKIGLIKGSDKEPESSEK